MKTYRIRHDGRIRYAVARDDGSDPVGTLEPIAGTPWADPEPTGETVRRGDVEILAPAAPTKVVCVARNFPEHAAERGRPMTREPLIFLKPPSAVVGPGAPIVRPPECRLLNVEGELGVVIGAATRRVSEDRAMDHVFGYTCVNDVTARDVQDREESFTRGKGYDTFAPMGPCIATGLDPDSLVVETRLDGDPVQRGEVARMAWSVPRLVAFVSSVMTLLPGDVIATGTPPGMPPVEPGTVVEVEVPEIGVLRNRVIDGGDPEVSPSGPGPTPPRREP